MPRFTPVNYAMVLDHYLVPLALCDQKKLRKKIVKEVAEAIVAPSFVSRIEIPEKMLEKLFPKKLYMRTVALLVDQFPNKPDDYALGIFTDSILPDRLVMPEIVCYHNGAIIQAAGNSEAEVVIAGGSTEMTVDPCPGATKHFVLSPMIRTTAVKSKRSEDGLSGNILTLTEVEKVVFDISAMRRSDIKFMPLRGKKGNLSVCYESSSLAFRALKERFRIYFDADFLEYFIQKLEEWGYFD